jgi:hypothetical protein
VGNVTVKLSRQYRAHDKVFDSVTLREPTYSDSHIDGLGVPAEWQRGPSGPVLYVFHTVVASYIERLAIEPTSECLTQIAVVDAMRLEKAVRDFFIEPEPSTTSETQPTG